jgi:hypothetical protein
MASSITRREPPADLTHAQHAESVLHDRSGDAVGQRQVDVAIKRLDRR